MRKAKARDVHDELRGRLREAAGAHEPDRARMLARVERGMAGADERPARAARPRARGWVRVVGATAAVAGVLAVGGYAVASAVRDEGPAQRTVAVSPSPDPSPGATSRAPRPADPPKGTGAPERSGKPAASPSHTPTARDGAGTSAPATPRSPAAGVEDGPLWSDGSVDPNSNDFWAQSNVTLKTGKRLTALTVELRIALTDGVSSAGAWRSLPEEDFTVTVDERDGFLVYTWVLKADRSVPAGEWVFAGQYDHARGGRDAEDDRYAATAETADVRLSVAGDFARRGEDDS
ncbi:hypothetical protein [Streptomyces sp. NPDC054842]